MTKMIIRKANVDDAQIVSELVGALLCELDPAGADNYGANHLMPATTAVLKEGSGVTIFVAEDFEGTAQGVITLNECMAIYAAGKFGEISELYVKKVARSSGLGEKLIAQAREFGKDMGWSRLEVGAPDVPKWQRSIDFYLRCGFGMVGPRLSIKT